MALFGNSNQEVLNVLTKIEVTGQEMLTQLESNLTKMGASLDTLNGTMTATAESSLRMEESLSVMAGVLDTISKSAEQTNVALSNLEKSTADGFTALSGDVQTLNATMQEATKQMASGFDVLVAAVDQSRLATVESFAQMGQGAKVSSKDIADATKVAVETIKAETAAVEAATDKYVAGQKTKQIAAQSAAKTAVAASNEIIAASEAEAARLEANAKKYVAAQKSKQVEMETNASIAKTTAQVAISADDLMASQAEAAAKQFVAAQRTQQVAAETMAASINSSNNVVISDNKLLAEQAKANAAAIASANEVITASYETEAAASTANARIIAADFAMQSNMAKLAATEIRAAMQEEAQEFKLAQMELQAANERTAESNAVTSVSFKELRAQILETAASMGTLAKEGAFNGLEKLNGMTAGIVDGLLRVADTAKKVAEGFGIAEIAVDAFATKAAAKFQTEMNNIQGNTTLTNQDMQNLSASLKDMSSQTDQTIPKLGEGLMHAANLGYTATESLTLLKEANLSAASTGANVADVTNILAGVMHEYSASINETANYMNTLHLASAKGNMTLEQFDHAAGPVIAQAANLGVTLQETGAAMSALTKHGFNYAQSGTQVANILSHIVHPSAAATKSLQELSKASGVDLVNDFTAGGLASKQLSGVFGDLHDAFGKLHLSEAQQADAMFKLIPAMRGGIGAMALAGTGADDFKNNLNDLNDAMSGKVNPTMDAFTRTQKTLGFQMGELKNNVDLAAIALGNVFLGSATGAATSLNGFMEQVSGTLEVLGRWEEKNHVVANALHEVWQVLQGFGDILGQMAGNVITNAGAFAKWASHTSLLADILNIARAAVSEVATVVKNVATAVEPVISAFIEWEARTHSIETVIKDFGGFVTQIYTHLINGIVPIIQGFIEWEAQTHALETAGRILGVVIDGVVQVIDSIGKAVGPVISSFIDWENQTHSVEKVITTLSGYISTIIKDIGILAKGIAPIVQAMIDWLAQGDNLRIVLAALGGMLTYLSTSAIVAFLAGVVSFALPLAAMAAAIWVVIEAFKHWGDDSNVVINIIRGALEGLLNFFKSVLNGIIDVINTFLKGVNLIAGVFGKQIPLIDHLADVHFNYAHAVDAATDALNKHDAAMNKINSLIVTADSSLAMLKAGYIGMSDSAIKAAAAHERLDQASRFLFDQTFANAPDKINQVIPGFNNMGVAAQAAAITQYELSTATGDVGDKLTDLAGKAGVTLDAMAQLAPIGDTISSAFKTAQDATQNVTSSFDAMTSATLQGMGRWTDDITNSLEAIDSQLQAHGEKGPQLYLDGVRQAQPQIQEEATNMARAGVKGTEGILPEYLMQGQVAGRDYTVGITLNFAASKDAALRNALNAVEGLRQTAPGHHFAGIESAQKYISGVMANLGLSTSAGHNMSQAALQGAEGVVPAFGALGQRARDAFIAGLKGAGVGGGGPMLGRKGMLEDAGFGGGGGADGFQATDMNAEMEKLFSSGEAQKTISKALTPDSSNDPLSGGGGGGGGKSGGGGGGGGGKGAKAATDPLTEMLKKAEDMGKAAEALSKLHGYYSVSQQELDAFTNDMSKVVDEFAARASHFDEATLKATTLYAEATVKIADGALKMVEALTKIRGYTAVGKQSMNEFNNDSSQIVDTYVAAGKRYNTDMLGGAIFYAEATLKAGEAILKMAEGLAKIRGYSSIAKNSMDSFALDSDYMVQKFVAAGHDFTGQMAEQATRYADTTIKVGDAISKMADGLNKIRGYSSVSRTSMDAFNVDSQYMVQKFVDAGNNYSSDMQKAATAFAETTLKVAEAITKMADGLNKVRTFSHISKATMDEFVGNTRELVDNFWHAGEDYDQRMQDAAKNFADTTVKVADAVSKMADALNKIRGYSQVGNSNPILDPQAFDAIKNFEADTRKMVEVFANAGRDFDAGMQNGAKGFADTATKVGDATGKMATGLDKIRGWAQVGSDTINGFAEDMGVIVSDFNKLGVKFDTGMQETATGFAGTATKVGEGVLKGVEGLTKLRDYAKVPAAAITEFVSDMQNLMTQIGQAAADFKGDIAKTGEFGKTIKEVFDGLVNATKVFTDLQIFAPVDPATVTLFVNSIRLVIQKIADAAPEFASRLPVINAFSVTIKDVFASLKEAVATFDALQKLKGINDGMVDVLINGMRYAINSVATLSTMSPEIVLKAKLFSDDCKTIFTDLKTAVEFFAALEKIKDGPAKQLDMLMGAIDQAISNAAALEEKSKTLMSKAANFAANMSQAAAKFKDGANAIAGSNSGGGMTQSVPSGAGSSIPGYGSAPVGTSGGSSNAPVGVGGPSGAANTANSGDGGATSNIVGPLAAAAQSANSVAKPAAVKSLPTSTLDTATKNNASILDILSKAADVADKMVGAIEKIATAGTIATEQLEKFMAQTQEIVTKFINLAEFYSKNTLEGATKYLDASLKVAEVIAKSVDALAKLTLYGDVSDNTISRFFDTIQYMVSLFSTPLTDSMTLALLGAQFFSDTASKVVAVIKTAVEGFSLLQTYAAVSHGSIDVFFDDLHYIVSLFAYPLQDSIIAALKGAQMFSDTALKVVDTIAKGAAGFKLLINYTQAGRANIDLFFQDLWYMVSVFAYPLQDSIVRALDGAKAFAETALKVVDVIKNGVAAFALLKNYTSIGKANEILFFTDIWEMVRMFAYPLSDGISRALEGARVFADTAQKVITVVKDGVDAFNHLKDYTGPGYNEIKRFATDIRLVVGMFSMALTDSSKDMLTNGASFLDVAVKAVTVIKDGVDALVKLKDYSRPSSDSIDGFVADIKYVVTAFEVALSDEQIKLMNGATTFSDTAVKVVATIKAGVEGLSALTNYSATSRDKIDIFVADVIYTVTKFVAGVGTVSTTLYDASTKYAEITSKFVDNIKKGVDSFAALSHYEAVSRLSVDTFISDLLYTIDEFLAKVNTLDPVAVKAGAGLADSIDKIVKPIEPAIKALTAMQTYWSAPDLAVTVFFQDLKKLIGKMATLAAGISTTDLSSITALGEMLIKATEGMKKSVDLLVALRTYSDLPDITFDSFFKALKTMLSKTAELANGSVGQLVTTGLLAFAQNVGVIFDTLKKALDLFGSLSNQALYPAVAIQALFDSFKAAIQQMAALQGQATQFYNQAQIFASTMQAAAALLVQGLTAPGNAIGALGGSTFNILPADFGKGAGTGGGGGGGPRSAANTNNASTANTNTSNGQNEYNISITITGNVYGDKRSMEEMMKAAVKEAMDKATSAARRNGGGFLS